MVRLTDSPHMASAVYHGRLTDSPDMASAVYHGRLTDSPDLASAVYHGRKASNQTNKQTRRTEKNSVYLFWRYLH